MQKRNKNHLAVYSVGISNHSPEQNHVEENCVAYIRAIVFLGECSETPLEFKRYQVTVPMRSAFSTRLPSGDLFWTHLHWRKSYCEGRVRNSNLGYVRIRPVIAVDFCPTLSTTSAISRLYLQVGEAILLKS